MTTKWLVLSVVLALGGCSSSQQVQISQPHRVAWDGLGRDPHVPVKKRTRTKTEEPNLLSEAELAELRPYSPEWVALRSAIDAEEQARISKLMVICTGCEVASNDANRTSPLPSPAPNRRTTEAR